MNAEMILDGSQARTEYYRAGTQPTEYCTTHVKVEVCNKTNKRANENCTDKRAQVFITRENAETNTSWKSALDAKYMAPSEVCEECKVEVTPEPTDNGDTNENNNNTNTNNTNTTYNNNTTQNNNTTNNTNTNTNTNTNANNTNTNRSN